jgi:hypothetical protein
MIIDLNFNLLSFETPIALNLPVFRTLSPIPINLRHFLRIRGHPVNIVHMFILVLLPLPYQLIILFTFQLVLQTLVFFENIVQPPLELILNSVDGFCLRLYLYVLLLNFCPHSLERILQQ